MAAIRSSEGILKWAIDCHLPRVWINELDAAPISGGSSHGSKGSMEPRFWAGTSTKNYDDRLNGTPLST